MKASTRRLALAIVMLATLTTQAPAQTIDGIIRLFGTAIENDMRRQEEQRQQQSIERQERQQQEEYRRREIDTIKRLQSALSSLGFYTKAIDGDFGPGTQAALERYQRAFGMPVGQVDIAGVDDVEERARIGFRSTEEAEKARLGGFSDRATMMAATQGGFSTFAEYAKARDAGFENAVDFIGFRNSGFSDSREYRAALNAGFATAANWQRARSAGFETRKEYDEFVASGLPDRNAWLAEKEQQRNISQIRMACISSMDRKDDLVILRECVRALATAPTDQTISEQLAAADARLERREAELTAETGRETKADGTAAKLDAVRIGRAEFACARLLIEKAWPEAVEVCSANKELYPASTALAAATASALEGAAKSEEQKAAAEAKRKREAEAEQKRLALVDAANAANALLDNVEAYSAAGNRFTSGLQIARGLVQLRAVAGGTEAEPIEHALLRLSALLGSETGYRTYIEEKQKSEQVARSNAAATALAESQRIDAFIQDFVALNVTHDAVPDLLDIQLDLSDAIASEDPLRLAASQSAATAKLSALGLGTQLAAFNYMPKQAGSESSVRKATNGLAITKLNEALLLGAEQDIVILNNTTPAAPHAIRNLVGALTFEGSEAVACWHHDAPARDLATSMAWKRVQTAGVRKVKVTTCQPESLAKTDIVLLRRGDFLRGNILYSRPFVELVEKGDFAVMATVLWSDIGAQADAERQLSQDIERGIATGARDGFGWLRLESETPKTCMITATFASAHEAILFVRAPFAADLPESMDLFPMDLERAFYAMQRGQCGVVYANSADLRTLILAAKREGIAYSVLPNWVTPQELKQIVDGLEQTAREETAQLEAARARKLAAAALEAQNTEAKAKLDAAKALADAETARAREALLRKTYGQEANGAYKSLEQTARGFFDASDARGDRTEFSRLFPALAAWQAASLNDGWEFAPIDGEIIDYGTASWKDRRSEVILARFEILSTNRVLGENKRSCFVIGYLIDAEFQMLRDPLEATCDQAQPIVSEWKQGRSFESRWNAE